MITSSFGGYLSKAHKEELLRRQVQSWKFLLSFLGFRFFTQVGRIPKLQAPVVRNVFCQSVLSVELNTQTAHCHKRYPRLFCLFFFIKVFTDFMHFVPTPRFLQSQSCVCILQKSFRWDRKLMSPVHPHAKDHLPTLKIVQGVSDFGVLWKYYNNPTCTKYALHSGVSPTPVFTLCESTQSFHPAICPVESYTSVVKAHNLLT